MTSIASRWTVYVESHFHEYLYSVASVSHGECWFLYSVDFRFVWRCYGLLTTFGFFPFYRDELNYFSLIFAPVCFNTNFIYCNNISTWIVDSNTKISTKLAWYFSVSPAPFPSFSLSLVPYSEKPSLCKAFNSNHVITSYRHRDTILSENSELTPQQTPD